MEETSAEPKNEEETKSPREADQVPRTPTQESQEKKENGSALKSRRKSSVNKHVETNNNQNKQEDVAEKLQSSPVKKAETAQAKETKSKSKSFSQPKEAKT